MASIFTQIKVSRCSSLPEADKGGEDGLSNGGVEVVDKMLENKHIKLIIKLN